MTAYQYDLLRWLRMVADNPHLDHRGTEPQPSQESLWGAFMHTEPIAHLLKVDGTGARTNELQAHAQREKALREFYRLEERK